MDRRILGKGLVRLQRRLNYYSKTSEINALGAVRALLFLVV